MMRSKKSLSEYSDRELLEIIFANQVNIFRHIEYLNQRIKSSLPESKIEALGHYTNTIKELIQDADSILEQADEYLDNEDIDKRFLNL